MSIAPPISLLLVDDEKHLLLSLSDHLLHEGFKVATATSGEDALAKLDATAPDLIILDISMPGMGGVGFLRRISREDGTTTYPVLVLTARGSMKAFFESIQVDGFLEKPCDESELVSKIREITARHRQSNEKQTRGRKRILLAEDDGAVARAIISTLETAGFDVVRVDKGPDVFDQCVVIKPDLFLLKEVISGLNGSAVASMLQVMPSAKLTPVIIFDQSRSEGSPKPKGLDSIQNLQAFLCTDDPTRLRTAVERVLSV